MIDKIVLGVARNHDVSAALYKGSRLLGIAEAERVIGIKHARGPDKLTPAIVELCAQHGIEINQIDAVAIADTGGERLELNYPNTVAKAHDVQALVKLGKRQILKRLPLGDIELNFRDDMDVYYSCHHACHALSSLYQAGYHEAAILVVDGYGVCCGTMAYHYKHGQLRRLESFKDAALIGWRYQLFGHFPKEINSEKTDVLDLAGKVMGLNAYGVVNEEYVDYFKSWFKKDFDDYKKCWNLNETFFEDLIPGGLRKDETTVQNPTFLNIISSMQEAYSQILEELAATLLNETKSGSLIVSGGCALNVLANTRLSVVADNVFFQPNSGDSGIALGAASAVAAHLKGCELHHPDISLDVRRNPYVGLELQDRTRIDDINTNGLITRKLPENEQTTSLILAERLASGQIIGIIRGRCEIGPRALGNRSILAYAACPDIRDVLNHKIKHREWWRPFAPVCRSVDAPEYFDFSAESPYMLIAANVRQEFRDTLISARHEDGTARLQILPHRDWHPLLWGILEELKTKTGVAVLINTSFNDSGKPLVNHAATAIDMLKNTQMDAVWINGLLFSKA